MEMRFEMDKDNRFTVEFRVQPYIVIAILHYLGWELFNVLAVQFMQ